MHQMFLNIGASERAGSGIPKIYSGWQSVNWITPNLYETLSPSEQTLLKLSTVSLIPEHIAALLQDKFSGKFNELDDFERMIVSTAAIEGWINHSRACQLTSKHPRDVTLALPRLETKGFLVSSGEKRDKSYSLPGMGIPTPEEVFSNSIISNTNLTHNGGSLTDSGTENITTNTEIDNRDNNGRLISKLLDRPFVDDLDVLSPNFKQQLFQLAQLPIKKKRLTSKEMRNVLIQLCKGHYVAISILSRLTSRTPQNLRQSHLKEMVDTGVLSLAFPNKPHSPKQGYTVLDK